MPGAQVSPTRVDPDQARIGIGPAAAVWLITWLVGNVIGAAVVSAAGYHSTDDAPVWVTMVLAAGLWAPMLDRHVDAQRADQSTADLRRTASSTNTACGSSPSTSSACRSACSSQLVVVRLVYWPLERGWPQTFSRSRVERNARDLYDQAHGGWLVGLVAVVVIGAPFVEELMYRGLLQGAAVRRLNDAVAVVAVAAFFAAIHFRWVEFPGLFVFGLILGVLRAAHSPVGHGHLRPHGVQRHRICCWWPRGMSGKGDPA